MTVVDQKRIAKNTLLLYVRMGVIMLIGLLVSRYIIKTLGKVDYGLYGAVGGIVIGFSFLNGVISSACNRYFAIEIGKNDQKALHKLFCLNVTIFIGIGILILLLAETLGLWYLNYKMVFPPDRAIAVNWVYQFSILSFMVNMMSIPYQSIIVAREQFGIFAATSFVEAVLKLILVFILIKVQSDKLICYSFLMFCLTLCMNLFYFMFSRHNYQECRYSFYWDKPLFKEIIGYTGWNIIGAIAGIGRFQGTNTIILNKLFGPSVNAAWQVAYQNFYLNINSFVTNFTRAFNPQIIKSYAVQEQESMFKLVFQSSKFSFMLLFFIILPVYIEAPFLISIWLWKVEIPEFATLFSRLILLVALIDTLSYPVMTAIQATGRIKWYQIVVGGVMITILPISYVLIKYFHYGPQTVFWVLITTSIVSQCLRLVFMKQLHGMSIRVYFKSVIWPILQVSAVSIALALLTKYFLGNGVWPSLIEIAVCLCVTGISVLFLGMTTTERKHFIETICNKLFHKRQNSPK